MAGKPNHSLQYAIGVDFCIENPSNIVTLLRIDCPLEETPLPDPIYEWTMILNEIEMNLEASNLRTLGVHMISNDNRSIDLNAAVILENHTTITVSVQWKFVWQ